MTKSSIPFPMFPLLEIDPTTGEWLGNLPPSGEAALRDHTGTNKVFEFKEQDAYLQPVFEMRIDEAKIRLGSATWDGDPSNHTSSGLHALDGAAGVLSSYKPEGFRQVIQGLSPTGIIFLSPFRGTQSGVSFDGIYAWADPGFDPSNPTQHQTLAFERSTGDMTLGGDIYLHDGKRVYFNDAHDKYIGVEGTYNRLYLTSPNGVHVDAGYNFAHPFYLADLASGDGYAFMGSSIYRMIGGSIGGGVQFISNTFEILSYAGGVFKTSLHAESDLLRTEDSFDMYGGDGHWFAPPRMNTAAQSSMVSGWGASEEGRLWYNTDNDTLCYWDGSAVACLTVSRDKVAVIKDIKPSGTPGGTFTAGVWETRDLNTIESDSIGVSLASNRFTLPAGKYLVRVVSPAYRVNRHQIRLYDHTTSSVAAVGSSGMARYDSNIQTHSIIETVIEISSSHVFSIQHWCSSTRNNVGMGRHANSGENEVYTIVTIQEVV